MKASDDPTTPLRQDLESWIITGINTIQVRKKAEFPSRARHWNRKRKLEIRAKIIFIFASEGPEFRVSYRGTVGPWSGTYHTAMKGILRVPCIVRWTGKVPEGVASSEIVQVTFLFTTLLSAKGTDILTEQRGPDRLLQNPNRSKSPRIGSLFYIKEDSGAVKWEDWKLRLVWEPKVNESSGRLESPYLFSTIWDPKEETDILAYNTWVIQPMMKLITEFKKSLDSAPLDPLKKL